MIILTIQASLFHMPLMDFSMILLKILGNLGSLIVSLEILMNHPYVIMGQLTFILNSVIVKFNDLFIN
jgi:hypothetical protein